MAFIGGASRVLLHLPTDGLPNMAESIRFLPEGMRFWGCYVVWRMKRTSQAGKMDSP